MEDYFPKSKPSTAWIYKPFIAEMNDNEQLNLHEQHLELQSSQAAKTKFSSIKTTYRNRLRVANDIRIALSNINLRIDELVSKRQEQRSH